MHLQPSSLNCRTDDMMSQSGRGNLTPYFRRPARETAIHRLSSLAAVAFAVTFAGCYIPGGGWTMRTGLDFRTYRKPGAYVEMVDTRWDEWNRLAVQNAMAADANVIGQTSGILPPATGSWPSTFGPMPSMTPSGVDNGSSMAPMAPAATDFPPAHSMPSPSDGSMMPMPVEDEEENRQQDPAMDSPAAKGPDAPNRSRVSNGSRNTRPNLVPVSTDEPSAGGRLDDFDSVSAAMDAGSQLSAESELAAIPLPPENDNGETGELRSVGPQDSQDDLNQDLDLDASDFARDAAEASSDRAQVRRSQSLRARRGDVSRAQQVSATSEAGVPKSSGRESTGLNGRRQSGTPGRSGVSPGGKKSGSSRSRSPSSDSESRPASAAQKSPSIAIPARAWMFRRR